MFWSMISGIYDWFETLYNGKVNREVSDLVAGMMKKEDRVLECACGTGMFSVKIGRNCRELIATDFSEGMLKQAKKKCDHLDNVKIFKANMMQLKCKESAFDKVVAGNVIHLLDDPKGALKELERVCKPGGQIIIPTYVNYEGYKTVSIFIKIGKLLGATFERDFDFKSYQRFFKNMGYEKVSYHFVEGRMPCAVAVIQVDK